jgi:hypothetical protein
VHVYDSMEEQVNVDEVAKSARTNMILPQLAIWRTSVHFKTCSFVEIGHELAR